MKVFQKKNKIRDALDIAAFFIMAAAGSGLDAPNITGNLIVIGACVGYLLYSFVADHRREVWYDAD